jgi:hypothetical protein
MIGYAGRAIETEVWVAAALSRRGCMEHYRKRRNLWWILFALAVAWLILGQPIEMKLAFHDDAGLTRKGRTILAIMSFLDLVLLAGTLVIAIVYSVKCSRAAKRNLSGG